jgi:integrase
MATIPKLEGTTGAVSYRVRYRLDGVQKKKTFKRKRDAVAFASTIEADKLRGVAVDPSRAKVTVEEVAKAWQAHTTTKRVSTAERDETIIRLHIVPAIGRRQIGGITKADIQKLVNEWTATKAPTTVGRHYTCLGAIFSYAVSDDIIMRSPCRDIRLPKTSLQERPVLTPKEVAALAAALGPDQACFMWLGIEGLRWSEAAAMTADRVDLNKKTITVDRQLDRFGNFEPPKSELGNRTFAINQALVDDLTALIGRQAHTEGTPGLLFTDTQGGHIRYSNWRRRIWKPACEAAGLPDLTFHDLRALAGTTLIAAGADIKTTQTRLGHASPQTTLRLYARAQPEADRLAADAAGAMMRG